MLSSRKSSISASGAMLAGDVLLVELVEVGLGARRDVLEEVQVGLLLVLVRRIAGHGDVALRAFLGDAGHELAVIEQPLLQIRRRTDVALQQLLKQGFDMVPVAEIGVGGDEGARKSLRAHRVSSGNEGRDAALAGAEKLPRLIQHPTG